MLHLNRHLGKAHYLHFKGEETDLEKGSKFQSKFI